LENLSKIEDGRAVLQYELSRYNDHQVHSTTGEIPSIRFDKAHQAHRALFRPFVVPKPYTSLKDIFCLRAIRTVNGYQRISLFNQDIHVPNVPLREDVKLHLIPDEARNLLEVRIWWNQKLILTQDLPLPKQFTFQL
jgi:hypothetical protein